ncbi:MAG: hypothetical protein GWN01_12820, partial [Nitrosopumilaceae archaeon]|nr:metal-dependent hydrolase [Nitrosopumilaceae archaeon]NIU86078.1 hypothetical protein [Nitrosopumilaceae archaeon]NIX62348.1 hypothetical protein [Nitrosopumilaceae archaeon]
MSSPVDPSLAGCISSAFSTAENSKINFRSFILFIFIANAPDLDFLPGIITGQPNLYHHGISHSIGIGIVVSLILALVLNHKKSLAIAKNFWLYFSLYISHLFLDYLSVDGRPPAGIPVFWPISGEYFIFPFPILPPILHSQF